MMANLAANAARLSFVRLGHADQAFSSNMGTSFSALVLIAGPARGTALDDCVAAPDANYSYVQVGGSSFDWSTFTTAYVLELTSQGWRDYSEVDHVIWKHWVTVVVPGLLHGPTHDTALVIIGDENNSDPASTRALGGVSLAGKQLRDTGL